MPRPVRIQRKRTKGWHGSQAVKNGLPIAYVNRPLRWGNPFSFPKGNLKAQANAVRYFETALRSGRLVNTNGVRMTVQMAKEELAGHNLGCFCPVGEPCHADVLLEIANA